MTSLQWISSCHKNALTARYITRLLAPNCITPFMTMFRKNRFNFYGRHIQFKSHKIKRIYIRGHFIWNLWNRPNLWNSTKARFINVMCKEPLCQCKKTNWYKIDIRGSDLLVSLCKFVKETKHTSRLNEVFFTSLICVSSVIVPQYMSQRFGLWWGFTAQSTQWGHVERSQFT